jgi:hypothetical protein
MVEGFIVKEKTLRALLYGLCILIFSLGIYLFNYTFVLKDEYALYAKDLKVLLSNKGEYSINVLNFNRKNGHLEYCILNDCNKEIHLPIERMYTEGYDGAGPYLLSMDFERYRFYPFNKKVLKQWSLVKDVQIKADKELYFRGLKAVLNENHIWEIYSVPLLEKPFEFANWPTQPEVFLNHNYLKSVCLLEELYEESKDKELGNYFNREILYLNDHVDEIVESNLSNGNFDPYILKLINLGLDERYAPLIGEWNQEGSPTKLMLKTKNDESFLLGGNHDLYSGEYLSILRFTDYYKIYTEYKKNNLEKFFYNKAVEYYNNSPYVTYGLCSLGLAREDVIEPFVLEKLLREVLTNDKIELLEGNIHELINCEKYINKTNLNIPEIEGAINNILQMVTINKDEYSLILRGRNTSKTDSGEGTITNFNLLDNLEYLLYVYEKK